MAHKKGVGSTDNGRDSKSKRLGVKLFGGQQATAGNIIVRQRGTRFHPGRNVYMGRDFTIHAAVDGTVVFTKGRNDRRFVSISPVDEVVDVPTAPPPTINPSNPVVVAPPTQVEPDADTVADTVAGIEDVNDIPVANVKAPEEETPAKKAKAPASEGKKDDLRKIEGVGPKIASILNDNGILTFAELAATDIEKIREILLEAGPRYKMHDPDTWPKQAQLAAEGKWDELKTLQDELDGGRKKD